MVKKPERIKLKVTLEFGRCSNCGAGTDIRPVMIETHTRLCLQGWQCYALWYLTEKKLQEELNQVWKAYAQRQAALSFLDWWRFHLKRTVVRRAR